MSGSPRLQFSLWLLHISSSSVICSAFAFISDSVVVLDLDTGAGNSCLVITQTKS